LPEGGVPSEPRSIADIVGSGELQEILGQTPS
jgi:hypothetical protein